MKRNAQSYDVYVGPMALYSHRPHVYMKMLTKLLTKTFFSQGPNNQQVLHIVV